MIMINGTDAEPQPALDTILDNMGSVKERVACGPARLKLPRTVVHIKPVTSSN